MASAICSVQMLDHMLPDDITQGIGTPLLAPPEAPVAAMERDILRLPHASIPPCVVHC
jgi:hypothetical protein